MISCRARSLGPAAAFALARPGSLCVHGGFRSSVNLELRPDGELVTLAGPAGNAYPHAVVLEEPADFARWGVAPGAPARLAGSVLRIDGACEAVEIELSRAVLLPARALPRVARLGPAHRAAAARLAELQAAAGCALRIDLLDAAAGSGDPLGAALRTAAAQLADAACAGGGVDAARLGEAAAALIGLGPGLTPAGDDFLCGFLAAARALGTPIADALETAARPALGRTGAISAFLVRCAFRGLWPAPLVDLGEALTGERAPEALAALETLCGLGHSSGADLATGFLCGLDRLADLAQGLAA